MSPRTANVPNPLAALIVARIEAIVEQMTRETLAERSPELEAASERTNWATVPIERLRAGILAAVQTIARDLEEGTHHQYAAHVVTIALPRARAGIRSRDIRFAIDSLARGLRGLCWQLTGPTEQSQALEQVGLIIEAAWGAVLDNFADATRVAVEEAHRDVIQALSTPIIPIHAGVLVLPLIGPVDVSRGELLMATLLPAIVREQAFGVLLDITGVPAIDAAVAGWLLKITRSSRLLGAEVILVGMRPETAETMVSAQLDLRGLVAFGSLQAGLEHVLARRGLVIQRRVG
ncbi:MAG: STAS domain-containing protein [Nannocystis sp.]|nr:STAS domain-containing protein [Nannocystis sp.]MBA3550005.1 STAS domain-containing protein [Nannocystis sp.]